MDTVRFLTVWQSDLYLMQTDAFLLAAIVHPKNLLATLVHQENVI